MYSQETNNQSVWYNLKSWLTRCTLFLSVLDRSENVFGEIPRIEVGRVWATRMECSNDGIHRPTVAGIHGNSEGCYSLALSGGYEDDVDLGTSSQLYTIDTSVRY